MKIALLSDIHGNLSALDAVLTDLSTDRVDQIICLGDALSSGPQPGEVLDRLRSEQVELVMGNADRRLLHPVPLAGLDDHVRMLMEIEVWIRQIVPADELAFLGNAQQVLHVKLTEQLMLLCCHGSPRSLDERLVAELTNEQLQEALADQPFDLLAAGHTHIRMLRSLHTGLLVNPGSVGSATGRGAVASYGILDATKERVDVSFRSVNYDVEPAIRQALSTGMPHAAWWANNWTIR